MNYQELRELILQAGVGETSNVFRALENAVRELEQDPNGIQNLAEYRKAISKIVDACDIYLNDKVNKVSTDNEEKERLARDMRNYMTQYYNKAIEDERKEVEKSFSEAKKMPRATADELKEISLLQKNVGCTKIKAKTTQITRGNSKARDIWNYIKHGLYTAIQTISNATLGGLAYLFTVPFTTTGKYEKRVKTELNTDMIPGAKGEKFDDLTKKVNEGAPDQPIISDQRRIPVVYEREILEDPDQGPTVTYNFHQSSEGRSIAYGKNDRQGHGFLTLKYTRVNPITGKKQRYESTFGFYPKGGFIGPNQSIGGVLNGMSVPGQLNDDFNHDVSVKKTVPATNQQINKIILAAQAYEKDGYNPVMRNCATFVHDMGVAAGLDVSFMQETDIDIEENIKLGTGLILGGPAMSRVGKYKMLKKADRDDFSYQRFGQKMLNKEDVLRLKKREYNIRMKGYVPSRVAEVLRAEHDSELSLNYIVVPEGQDNYVYGLKQLETGVNSLLLQLDLYAKKHPGEEVAPTNAKLGSFLNSKYLILKNLAEPVFKGTKKVEEEGKVVEKPMSYKEHRQLIERFSKEVQESIDNITEIYNDAYKGAPELNLMFQRFTGNFYYLKSLAHKTFEKSITNLEYIVDVTNKNIHEEDYSEFVDFTRDDAEALKSFLFERQMLADTINSPSVNISKLTLLAGIKIFGSAKEFVRLAGLKGKKETDAKLKPEEIKNPLTEAQLKEVAMYERKTMHLDLFVKAEKSLLYGRELTANDYKYYFSDLPKNEAANMLCFISSSNTTSASKDCQMIAFNKIFGGLKQKLSGLTYEKIIEDPGIVKQLMSEHLANKLKENKKEFNKLMQAMVAVEMEAQPFDQEKDEIISYKQNLTIKAYEKIETMLESRYLEPVLGNIYSNIVKSRENISNKEREELGKAVKLGSNILSNDPKLSAYREAMREQIGYQPGFKAVRSSLMVEVGKLIERKSFNNTPENRMHLGKMLAAEEAIISGKRAGEEKGEINEEYLEKRGKELAKLFENSNDEEFNKVGKTIAEAYIKSRNRVINKTDCQAVEQISRKLKEMQNKELDKSKDNPALEKEIH